MALGLWGYSFQFHSCLRKLPLQIKHVHFELWQKITHAYKWITYFTFLVASNLLMKGSHSFQFNFSVSCFIHFHLSSSYFLVTSLFPAFRTSRFNFGNSCFLVTYFLCSVNVKKYFCPRKYRCISYFLISL